MKTTSFKSLLFLFVTLLVIFSTSVFAGKPVEEKESKAIKKIRKAAENAGPHDWYTLAECTEKCLEKGINTTEAYEWIRESISINKNPYNLIVLGDYYKANNLPFEAINAYVDSIKLGLKKNINYTDPQTVAKIIELRKILYLTK